MENNQNQPQISTLDTLVTEKKPLKKRILGIVLSSTLGLFCLFMVFVLIFTITVTLCEVNMHSMMPNLEHESHVLLANWPRNLRRGDVVTVNTPAHYRYPNSGRPANQNVYLFIKRIVATGGDTVIWRVSNTSIVYYYVTDNAGNERRIYADEVYLYIIRAGETEPVRINETVGERILEPMAFSSLFDNNFRQTHSYSFVDGFRQYSYTVSIGSVYVLGDNRNNSVDSRRYGSFLNSDVTGRMFAELTKGGALERLLLWFYGSA